MRMRPVRIILMTLLFGVLMHVCPDDARAQFVILTGGDITLTLGPPAVPGGDPTPATNASRRLIWLQIPRQGTFKILVSTLISSQSFDLYVTATNVRNGTPAPTVQLTQGMAPTDFVTNVSRLRPISLATLLYRAEAPAETGSSATQGNDVHTVVYTFTSQ